MNLRVSAIALCALVFLSGCVSKYSDIVSDFHTIQVGPRCTTVGFDERKFNGQTIEPESLTCSCSQLISVKRLAKKANESPEAWSCPDRVHPEMYQTVVVPSASLHHQPSLASTYVPAAGMAAAGVAVGGGIAAAQAARMTQSVGGTGTTVFTSTFSNQPIKGLQFLSR